MSKREGDEVLGLLRGVEPAPLTDEAEAARRQRIVARIDELRSSLGASNSTDAGSAGYRDAALEHRTQAVVSLGSARARPRFATWARVAAVVLPMAAAVAIWLSSEGERTPLFVVVEGDVMVESSEGDNWLARDDRWPNGDAVDLATRDTAATVVLPSRTQVQLDGRTRATVGRLAAAREAESEAHAPTSAQERASESVKVDRGAVKVSSSTVEPRSVVVVTEQAKVVVRGAMFAVSVAALSSESGTRVVVHEGEAFVDSGGRQYRLTTGQEWSSEESAEQGSRATSHAAGEGAHRDSARGVVSRDAGAREPANADKATKGAVKTASSDLAEQNRLFEAGRAARRAGQSARALRLFSELMNAYPNSEQAHNARVEHFRLLRALNRREDARRSARAYLNKYPKGFAAAEARELTR